MAVSSRRMPVACLLALSLMAGCTFMPMAMPGARELIKVLPGSLSARQNTIDVRLSFGSSFTTQNTAYGYKADDVAFVVLAVIPDDLADLESNKVFGGTSTWSAARVADSVTEGWEGEANTYSFKNLPPGKYSIWGQAQNAAKESITENDFATSRGNVSPLNASVTVSPDGTLTYGPVPARHRVDLKLKLKDAPESETVTGITFEDGKDATMEGVDNYTAI